MRSERYSRLFVKMMLGVPETQKSEHSCLQLVVTNGYQCALLKSILTA